MIGRDLGIGWTDAWLVVVTATGVYAAMIALSKLFGQRQFARASTYDLAFIFAVGSVAGRVVLVRTSLAAAALGLTWMFLLHAGTGYLHHNVALVHRFVQNAPILLVHRGELLEDNVRRAHTSALEVHAQVRLAGIGSLDAVEAVILERNGGMSVIERGTPVDPALCAEVVGRERLRPGGGRSVSAPTRR